MRRFYRVDCVRNRLPADPSQASPSAESTDLQSRSRGTRSARRRTSAAFLSRYAGTLASRAGLPSGRKNCLVRVYGPSTTAARWPLSETVFLYEQAQQQNV